MPWSDLGADTMNKRPSIAAVASLAVGLAALGTVRAEVSAETDLFGNYLRTTVYSNASTKNVRVWTVLRFRRLVHPLNTQGDLLRDSWPTIAENPADHRWPWVIWSRFNGSDHDLVWSRWLGNGWSRIGWVESQPAPGDDLDPSLSFDVNGRPHMVWWRNEGGIGRVYLSRFQGTEWMAALPVSDASVDSRYPTVTVLSDGTIQVDYETPQGHATALLVLEESPWTITDDLDPVGASGPPPPKNSPGNSKH